MKMRPGRRDTRASRLFVVALVIAGLLPLASPSRASDGRTRLVAVGDVHGNGDGLAAILHQAALIDDTGKWSGGTATLVQLGDCFDRGAQVRQVLDLLMALGPQAAAAGGRVVALLGNHEAMNLLGETRDINPAVYGSFAGSDSEALREQAFADYEKLAAERKRELDSLPGVYTQTRDQWMAAHPPGYLEYRASLEPNGIYGKWLRQHPAVIVVDGTALMHAGIDPDNAPDKIEAINKQVKNDLATFDEARKVLVNRKVILPWFSLSEVVAAVKAEAAAIGAASTAAQAGDVRAAMRLQHVDQHLLDALRGVLGIGRSSLLAPDGPLWFRGFAMWSSQEGAPRITALLGHYNLKRFVVGHTMLSGFRITPRFSSRVFLIDTGMLTDYYKDGHPSALSINDRINAIYLDSTQDLTPDSQPVSKR